MNYPSLSMHVRGSSLLDNRSLRALRMKATTIRHMTKKTIMYMHQASKPLHYTLQTPWRLFRDSTMRGLHLAKPQGTNTTPLPKISGGAGSGARADGIVVQMQRELREGSQLAHRRGQRGRSLRASQRCCGETCPFFRAPRRRGR